MEENVFVNERHREFLELIEGRPLKNFLKTYNIPAPQSKDERRKKILESLTNSQDPKANQIPIYSFEKWIQRWYIPGNKNVFIYELDDDCVKHLNKLENIEQIISVNRIREKMGSLETTDFPIDPKLIHLDTRVDGQNNVQRIELGFVQMGQLREIDEENDIIKWTHINYYVFIEINIQEKQLTVWLEPTKKLQKLGNAKKGSYHDVAEDYKKIISAMFGLSFKENIWISKALYLMWEEDTKIEDGTIRTKLNECEGDIQELIKGLLPKLEIIQFTEEEITKKVMSLFEGLLIREYEIELPEKPGWVRRHKVFDGTATVEAFNDMPIYTSSSHYGLQAIVNEVGEVNKLEYSWKSPQDDDDSYITTISVLDGCFLVNFWGFREEEEIRHVLSGINGYKQRIFNPPGNNS